MKRRFTRILALLAVLALIVGLLSSCSSSNTKPIETVTPESSKAAATTPEPTEASTATPESTPEPTSTPTSEPTFTPTPTMSPDQRNSIIMLNYIAGITQEINASKNSRLYLENTYSSLFNNTHPNAVDEKTQDQLIFLLDTMNNYRMLTVKRQHIQFLYEQNRAQAMRSAVPNPLGLLSAVSSFDWKRIAVAVVYMAVDSYTSYKNASSQADLQFIQDGWELDEEEQKVLHNINIETFRYLNETVRAHGLSGDLALTDEAITVFVNWKNNTNAAQRIRWLESNQERYKAYGDYWLVLAESYYDHGDYEKCLDALTSYESLEIRIFRDDKGYAKVLPLGIISANEVYDTEKYILTANRYCEAILQSTDDIYDWALRYFAAQTYVNLFAKTGDQSFLRKAYEIALDNSNWLIEEQKKQNAAYLADVKEETIPKDATAEQKKEIENYNKQIKEDRKLALPPIYEPLLLNCDLLFSLADKLQISDAEKANVDEILHENGGYLFLIPTLDADFTFGKTAESDTSSIEISFTGKDFIIPAKYVSNGVTITVTVKAPDSNDPITFTDWSLTKVERPSKNALDTFKASFTSSGASKYHFEKGSQVQITISSTGGIGTDLAFEYDVVNTKTDFFSSIAFWNSDIGFARKK